MSPAAVGGHPVIRGARAVWTGHRVLADADVWCAGGEVVAITRAGSSPPAGFGAEPANAEIDATGCIVIPGLVNAHHHLLQTAFRTLPGTRHVPMREWLPTMAAAYGRVGVDGELSNAAARAGLAEALLCGVTTVADHHLTWPKGCDDVGIAEGTADAARELGARLVFVRGTAGDDPDAAATSAEAIIARLGARSADGRFGIGVGPAGVHSDAPETFATLGEVAASHGLPRRTQANEQVDVEIAEAKYGRRPLELLDEWGWLEAGVTIAHLCDVSTDQIAAVAASGATATHAPGCDLPMGWGLAPAGALLDAGITVGLGTSGGGSNDAGHLLADARLAMQASPLAGRPLTAEEALSMATAGSAIGLGRPELGHLEPGAAADVAIYDLRGVADVGVADPLAGLLWASPGRRPRDVVVGGRLVVEQGELVATPERAIATDLAGLLAQRGAAA